MFLTVLMQCLKDAERIVFKAFGSSRRLSEREKRRIATVMALRSQCMQQELSQEEAELRRAVSQQRRRRDRLEHQLAHLNAKVDAVVRHHRLDRPVTFVDMHSTSDVLRMGDLVDRCRDDVQHFDDSVNQLLSRFARLLMECCSMKRRLEITPADGVTDT